MKTKVRHGLVLLSLIIISFNSWACFYDLDRLQCAPNTTARMARCNYGLVTGCTSSDQPLFYQIVELCAVVGREASLIMTCPEPEPEQVKSKISPNRSAKICGSIIKVDNQVLMEKIPVIGTSYSLVYSSDKVPGRKDWYKTQIPITHSTFSGSSSVTAEKLKIIIAGKEINYNFPAPISSGLSYSFTWDGKDVDGNNVYGSQLAKVSVSEQYNFPETFITVYYFPEDFEKQGTQEKGTIISNFIPVTSDIFLGTIFHENFGISGWDIDVHHSYDEVREVLYLGSGDTFSTKFTLKPSGERWIVSEDRSFIYIFDSNWRHIKTKNTLTGSNELVFTYNASNQLQSIEDAFGNITTIQYTSGQVTSITSPFGKVTGITTNANGYIESVTNPSSENYEMTYTTDGLLLTFQKPSGAVSTMTYDSDGKLLTDTSSEGGETTLARTDLNGNFTIQSTSGLGRVNEYQISNDGNYTRMLNYSNSFTLTHSENATSNISSYSDSSGLTISSSPQTDTRFGTNLYMPHTQSVSDGSAYQSKTYAETSSLADPDDPFSFSTIFSSWDINSKSFTSTYTASSRTKVDQTPLGRTITTVYNTKARPVSVQEANYTPVAISYNSNGQINEVAQGASRITKYTYDITSGFLTSIENAIGQVTSYTYDLVGRVLTQTLPDTRVVSYTYDANGNIASITPSGRPSHQMSYNSYGALTSYTPPMLTPPSVVASTYYYSDDRELLQITRPDGLDIDFNYGATTGNLDSIDLPTGTRSFYYYNGVLNQSISEDFFTRYISQSGTKITSDTFSGGSLNSSLNRTYNNDILLSNEDLTVGSSVTSVVYTYNNDNLMTAAGTQIITRSASTGKVSQAKLGNAKENFTYSTAYGEIETIQGQYNTTQTYLETITRDNLGRIVTKTEQYSTGPSNVYAYTYDSAGRLTTVSLNNNSLSSYSYDSSSNRTSQTINGVTKTATYDDQDRLLTFGTKSFTYNLNGEVATMTDGGVTTTYTYDVLGNLKGVSKPTKNITYQVDAHNRRMLRKDGATVKNYFIWDAENRLVGTANASGALTARFVYGSKPHIPDYVIKGSTKYKIITDHLGSPVQVIHSTNGTISQQITYDEFGNILTDSSPGFTPFGFAGCLYDQDTKLCRFGVRDYDASIGRWLSKDPILFGGGDTNLYGYVFNDPMNLIDNNGLNAKNVAKIFAEVVIEGSTNLGPFEAIGSVAGGMAAATFMTNPVGIFFVGYMSGEFLGLLDNPGLSPSTHRPIVVLPQTISTVPVLNTNIKRPGVCTP